MADVDFVELCRDVLANSTRLDEFKTALVDLHVNVPQLQRSGIGLAEEQGPLQGRVVAAGHREAVQGQDVVFLDLAGGGPVVGAVGVDAGLEPDPGVTDLRVREGAGDLVDHGFGTDQGDLVLGDSGLDGVANGLAAEVADAGTVLDDLDFLGRLDHALAHRGLCHVNQGRVGEGSLDLVPVIQRQGVILDADPARLDAAGAQDFLDCVDVVVPAPVRVHKVLAVAAAPRHAGVDICRDGDRVILGDHHAVGTAEVREEEVGVVLDGVVAGEDHGVEVLICHDAAEASEATLELGVGEGQRHFLTVVEDLEALELGDVVDSLVLRDGHGSFLSMGVVVFSPAAAVAWKSPRRRGLRSGKQWRRPRGTSRVPVGCGSCRSGGSP